MARKTRLLLVLAAAGALLATAGAASAEPHPSALELRVAVDDCPEARP